MNNEILEISQWLHEKGFECDFYQYDIVIMQDQNKDGWRWKEIKTPVLIRAEECQPNSCPYMSLNRALELLPLLLQTNRDNPEAPHVIMIGKKSIAYSVASGGYRSAPGFYFSGDLHLAALRLLKKTVEENYVKAI